MWSMRVPLSKVGFWIDIELAHNLCHFFNFWVKLLCIEHDKRWCNPVKLLHHFFTKQVQTCWKHDAIKLVHPFSKQVPTCKKHNAVKPIYCIITIFKQASTCFKDDAIIPKKAMIGIKIVPFYSMFDFIAKI